MGNKKVRPTEKVQVKPVYKKRIDTDKAYRELAKFKVTELYLQGNTMRDIQAMMPGEGGAEHPSITTIHRYVNDAIKEWREDKINLINDHKAIELAKINRLEVVLWESWEASAERDGIGDPRYTDGILKCIQQRCKIIGLDMPDVNLNLNQQVNNITTTPQVQTIKRTTIRFETRKTTMESADEVITETVENE